MQWGGGHWCSVAVLVGLVAGLSGWSRARACEVRESVPAK